MLRVALERTGRPRRSADWIIWKGGAAYSLPLPPVNRNGATSETPGALSTEKGMGRQTARADDPTRAVSKPLSTPSPIRAEMREAIPWPTSCCKQAVADRHAAGDGDMGADRARELDEAEEARPPAVDFGDPPYEPHDLGDDKHDVEHRARADRGDQRHALGRGGDLALRLVVERPQERPFGDVDEVASVDDPPHRILDLRPGVRRLGPLAIERDELHDEAARRDAIVSGAGVGEGDMHLGNSCLARDCDHFARRNADEADQEHQAEDERR